MAARAGAARPDAADRRAGALRAGRQDPAADRLDAPADVPGPAAVRPVAGRCAAALERAPRADLHGEPRGHEALPQKHPRAGHHRHRPRRRTDRGNRRPHQRHSPQGDPAAVQYADPGNDPLRILLATDAAREGLNFQAHCADLFHFDLPWNPGRIEQRNGRIDRKLQPEPEVRCHYFVLPQREEDRVLEVLVRKTETIRRELGSLSKVIDDDVERRLRHGIRHRDADKLKREIEAADLDAVRRQVARDELEAARDRRGESRGAGGALPGPARSVAHLDRIRRRAVPRRAVLRAGAAGRRAAGAVGGNGDGSPTWTFPPLDRRAGADPSWAATLDTLRPPRKTDQKLAEWRRDAPIRPVVFEDAGVLSDDTVHLHLEQRVAQRLLARFRAQGFVHHDLSRACLAQARDSIPRVILLGRLCLFGRGAERPARGNRAAGGALGGSRAARTDAASLPAGRGDADSRPPGTSVGPPGPLAQRNHPLPAAGRGPARHRGTVAPARAACGGAGGACRRTAARARRT